MENLYDIFSSKCHIIYYMTITSTWYRCDYALMKDTANLTIMDQLCSAFCEEIGEEWFCYMMTSSNGNIFHVTGHLCGEFTGDQWIPRTNGQWRGALMFSLICARKYGWVNSRKADDLKHCGAHYNITVMIKWFDCICHYFAVLNVSMKYYIPNCLVQKLHDW